MFEDSALAKSGGRKEQRMMNTAAVTSSSLCKDTSNYSTKLKTQKLKT